MNILIIRVSAIGDVIHTLPAIFLLKTLFPSAQIHWLVQEKAAELLHEQPFIDHLWILPNKFVNTKNWPQTWRIIKNLQEISWDAILDFQGILKTSLFTLLLSGKKFGFSFSKARLGLTTLLTNYHINPHYSNIIQKNLALANALRTYCNSSLNPVYKQCSPTLATLNESFPLQIPAHQQTIVDEWFTKNNISNFILLAPNTTWESKLWPLEYWQKLITKLSRNSSQYTPVLIGETFGSQAKILANFIHTHNLEVNVLPEWDLLTIANLISRATLIVAPDTGVLHLADLLGTTSIGIFGPTNAKQHGPFICAKNINNAIQIPCKHLYQKSHGIDQCMHKLSPQILYKKIEKCL